jgi:hypothetical protein
MRKNVGEWREGGKCVKYIKGGRKERLRNEDMEEIISF